MSPRNSDVWREPVGGLLEPGWYATTHDGKRLGPFDTKTLARAALAKAGGGGSQPIHWPPRKWRKLEVVIPGKVGGQAESEHRSPHAAAKKYHELKPKHPTVYIRNYDDGEDVTAEVLQYIRRGPVSAGEPGVRESVREGRRFKSSEWLEFECDPATPTKELEDLAGKFSARLLSLADVELRSREFENWWPGGAPLALSYDDEDRLVWLAYASIVGHGVGLWEGDGSTGLPGEVEKKLDKIVKADAELSRFAHQISDECSTLRDEAEVVSRRMGGRRQPDRSLNEGGDDFDESYPTDEDKADELELYSENTGELYPEKMEIRRTLRRLQLAGTYTARHAIDAWRPWVEKAAKRYQKEINKTARFSANVIDRMVANITKTENYLLATGEFDGDLFGGRPPRAPRGELNEAATGRKHAFTLDGEPVDFQEFLTDNSELDPAILSHLRSLPAGASYTGGGGAQPVWVLHRLPYESYVVMWNDDVRGDIERTFPTEQVAIEFAKRRSIDRTQRGLVLVHARPGKWPPHDDERGWASKGHFYTHEEESAERKRDYHRGWAREGAEAKVTRTTAKRVGDKHRVNWSITDLEQFRRGLEVEQEHTSDLDIAARIALDHLIERPDYYARLDKAGLEAGEAQGEYYLRLRRGKKAKGTFPPPDAFFLSLKTYPTINAARLAGRDLVRGPIYDAFLVVDAEGNRVGESGASEASEAGRHRAVMRVDKGPGRAGMYRYGPALIWISGPAGGTWWATVKFRSQEKDLDAPTLDEVLVKAMDWVDAAPELAGASEVKDNPITVDAPGASIPWVKVTRDPEKYQAALAAASEYGSMGNSRKIYDLLSPVLAKEDQEVMLVVLLDVRQNLRGVAEVHRGGRSRVAVNPLDILRVVVVSGAERFAICHNHPTGNASPSKADADLTKAIERASKEFKPDTIFIDHVVIGLGEYYSFADKKLSRVGAKRKKGKKS